MSSVRAALAWVHEGLCAQVGGDFHHPEKGDSVRDPKQVCAGCPVATTCLDYAINNRERFGVWGGLSERERRRVAAERAQQQSPTTQEAEEVAA